MVTDRVIFQKIVEIKRSQRSFLVLEAPNRVLELIKYISFNPESRPSWGVWFDSPAFVTVGLALTEVFASLELAFE